MTKQPTNNEKEKSKELTRVSGKHYSPLTIRKYTRPGYPLFVALITDDSLEDLDVFITTNFKLEDLGKNIEEIRQQIGTITNDLVEHYKKAEGVAVIAFADKLVISSLWGDFMVHAMCRQELYFLLNMTTGV